MTAKRRPTHRDAKFQVEAPPRIISGQLRGRRIRYSGDPRTRPMRDRVRQALFNRLQHRFSGRIAFDLFAGTGALGLEAISRGASVSYFFESHAPTADILRDNAKSLGVEKQSRIVVGDTFQWFSSAPQAWRPALVDPDAAWVVFCSPPFAFFRERADEMLRLLLSLWNEAPADSDFAVESDSSFDFAPLASFGEWDVRDYGLSRIGTLTKDSG